MEDTAILLNLDELRRSCGSCALHELCLSAGIDDADLARLDHVVRDRRALDRGSMLFRQEDPFHALYVVRSGSFKTYVQSASGDVQILGFSLPGEVLGVAALADDRHPMSAEALERSSICELPIAQLQQIVSEVPSLHRQLMRVVGREAVADSRHLVMMGRQQAQERLAIFLRSLSERYGRLSRDTVTLTLPMSRNDIANYLGLVVETVSRVLSRMEAAGVLAVNRKSVSILRPDLLAELCSGEKIALRGDKSA